MVDLNNTQVGLAGYVPSSLISFMHLEDIIVAFMLGFVGSAGAFFFRWIQGKLSKQRVSPKILEKIYISLFITIEKKLNNFNIKIYYE